MHQPLVLQVFSDFGFNRGEVADHIRVGEHDSLGLGCGAGSENDLECVGRLNLHWTKAFGLTFRDCARQIDGIDGCDLFRLDLLRHEPVENRGSLPRTHHQPGSDLRTDAARKIGTGGIIDGNGNDPAKRASQERRHPLGAVRTPQQHRIALGNVACFELAGKLIRHSGDLLVVPTLAPVSSRKHVGAGVILAPALEIVQRIQHTCPHTLFSSTIPRTLQGYRARCHSLMAGWGWMTRFFTVRSVIVRIVAALAMCGLISCQPPASTNAASSAPRAEFRQTKAPWRDLSQDETAGGHILRKHVGQTDEQLRERLEREPGITGASTYTDRLAAEHAVGAAIAESHGWTSQPGAGLR